MTTSRPELDISPVGILRIDHVGIAVADLDVAVEFYARVFGLRVVHEETNEEQGVREAMLAVGPDGDGGRLQLLAPLNAGVDDREVPGPQRSGPAATGLHGGRHRCDMRRAAVPRRAAAVRDAEARHVGIAGQLRAPEGRRRRARGSWWSRSPPASSKHS